MYVTNYHFLKSICDIGHPVRCTYNKQYIMPNLSPRISLNNTVINSRIHWSIAIWWIYRQRLCYIMFIKSVISYRRQHWWTEGYQDLLCGLNCYQCKYKHCIEIICVFVVCVCVCVCVCVWLCVRVCVCVRVRVCDCVRMCVEVYLQQITCTCTSL